MAAYRYSTSGYVGLQDATYMRDAAARGENPDLIQRQRNRMDVNISQNLGDRYGQFFLTGSVLDYWNARGRQVNFSAGLQQPLETSQLQHQRAAYARHDNRQRGLREPDHRRHPW